MELDRMNTTTNKPDNMEDELLCPSTEGMLELDNLKLNGGAAGTATGCKKGEDGAPQLPLMNVPTSPLDNDYDDDSDHDEGISSSYHQTSPISSPTRRKRTTYFLGRAFHPPTDRLSMSSYQKSLYWFTYRNDLIVPLRPYSSPNAQSIVGNITHGGGLSGVTGEGGMKTDAGWGCMLRSAQMMLAEAVRRHYSPISDSDDVGGSGNDNGGRNTKTRNHSRVQHEDPSEAERIANWFADFPNHETIVEDDDYDTCNNDGEEKKQQNGDGNIYDQDANANSNDDEASSTATKDSYGKGGLSNQWYSLHQMVAAGLGLGILPGEWYGPTTACHVLRELNEIHCERREGLAAARSMKSGENDDGLTCDMFRVHIATEGCIYLDAISKLMTQNSGGGGDGSSAEAIAAEKESAGNDKVANLQDPLSLISSGNDIDDPLRPTPTQQQQQSETSEKDAKEECWDTSLLLLLPLRLGLQSISTTNYGSTLAKLLSFPHSVGMLGGTPRHALWFYGADAVDHTPSPDDGIDQDCAFGWYGLDPHTVQQAPRGIQIPLDKTKSANNEARTLTRSRWQVQLTDEYLRSLHCSPNTTTGASHPNHQRPIPLSNLDPSCALGFYIRDSSDLTHFRSLLKGLSEEHCRLNKLPEVMTVLEKTPNYDVDGVGSVVADGLDGFSMQSEEDAKHEDYDDDDFVLI